MCGIPWFWLTGRMDAFDEAAELDHQAHSIAKTVQVGWSLFEMGKALNNAGRLAQSMKKFIPSVQVMDHSFCDSSRLFNSFNTIANTAGIAANVVLTYQGVQALELIAARLQDIANILRAQTALLAHEKFAQYVYKMIIERLGGTANDRNYEHWFFVYHPDNDWYPDFYGLLEEEPPGPRFCAYTNQLDTMFVFMLAARQKCNEEERTARKQRRRLRPVMFHLLIPAYQSIVIPEALTIPEEIGEFIIEGRISGGTPMIWLNLRKRQRHYVLDIGEWVPPTPSWWEWAQVKFGLAKMPSKEHRVLGSGQRPRESAASDDRDSPDVGDDYPSSRARSRYDSTPLHQQRSRQHGSHRSRRASSRC